MQCRAARPRATGHRVHPLITLTTVPKCNDEVQPRGLAARPDSRHVILDRVGTCQGLSPRHSAAR
jgi:hypothetical protein